MSLEGRPFTITAASFTYYNITRPEKCLAFGPGLITEGNFTQEAQFMIISRDKTDSNRSSGSDNFVVSITQGDPDEADSAIEGKIKDNQNGTYTVSYAPKIESPGVNSPADSAAGGGHGGGGNKNSRIVTVHVCLAALGEDEARPIRGSPFKASFTNR